MEEKDFPLEKILTVSARDYVESRQNYLSNYIMVGVYSSEDINDFARRVPGDAEIVVDYREFPRAAYATIVAMSGTALIPKKNRE